MHAHPLGLGKQLPASCPLPLHCKSLLSLCYLQWCSQTVPKCGSFQSNVEAGVLPAIATVLNAQELGENAVQSLGEAIPGLLQASPASSPPAWHGLLLVWAYAGPPAGPALLTETVL